MAIELYDAVGLDGYFNLAGKAFFAQQTLNTARLTTVPTEVTDVLTAFKLLTSTAALQTTVAAIPNAVTGYQSSGDSLAQVLSAYTQNLLIEMAQASAPLTNKSLGAALTILIAQMKSASESVDASTVTITATAGGSNTGDGRFVVSTKRADGLVQENSLVETITATVTSDTTPANARYTLTSAAVVANLLSQAWPGGSGLNASLTAYAPATSGLLTNSEFEDATVVTNSPDGWFVSVGVVGTDIKQTVTEVQTLTIAATPADGAYIVSWVNAAGKSQSTTPLAYNAAGTDLQAALNLLEGLELVTVSTAGTSPNFTHTITFTGRGGNVAQFTATETFTVGTITPATTTAGTSQVYSGGKALWLLSDGATLTTINQQLTGLTAATAYGVSLWALCDVVPGAGVITIDLVDGIGGTVINDDQAVANSITFNASALSTTTWKHLTALSSGECVFRTPTIMPDLVFIRVRISTAVTNTRSVFIDRMSLAPLSMLYPGGPLVAAFSGATEHRNKDTFAIAVTNDRAGALQEWCNRNWGLANLGLLLPSNTAAAETIPDSVIG